MLADTQPVASSFRDPSGFLFTRDGVLYRQINLAYRPHLERMKQSGLYDVLIKRNLMVSQEEVDVPAAAPDNCYMVVEPWRVPMISYPYEWCFSQLKDAALLTLQLQLLAFDHGMVLKDASAYNIQFHDNAPILIDTLSFETYQEGEPWVAYRQFCQHFLAPLALMSLRDVRLGQLLRIHIDGVPLDLASALLPARTRLNFSLLSHLHLHARSQQHFGGKKVNVRKYKIGKLAFRGLIESLQSAIRKLRWKPSGTEWADYYQDTNYTADSFEQKKKIVAGLLEKCRPSAVLDLGANTGIFSRLAAEQGILALAVDSDPGSVEKNYLDCRRQKTRNLLPLLVDLTNPSPSIGWANDERASLFQRNPADTVMALALIHHLAISNNVPLPGLAEFFARIARQLIIEWVPKDDSQVERLLVSREDIFTDYTREAFEREFSRRFRIQSSHPLPDSGRVLYLMEVL